MGTAWPENAIISDFIRSSRSPTILCRHIYADEACPAVRPCRTGASNICLMAPEPATISPGALLPSTMIARPTAAASQGSVVRGNDQNTALFGVVHWHAAAIDLPTVG